VFLAPFLLIIIVENASAFSECSLKQSKSGLRGSEKIRAAAHDVTVSYEKSLLKF